ncbi:hypothetical protein ACWCQR_50160, partial [Streptomyces sp. NPDC002172]
RCSLMNIRGRPPSGPALAADGAFTRRSQGRAVLRRQGAVRVVVASTIAKPSTARDRPAHRFGLIEHALAPWIDRCGPTGRADAEQLVRGLALVISAESLFALMDLCDLTPDDAVAGLVTTARQMTAAAVAAAPTGPAAD